MKIKVAIWGTGKEYNSKINILKYYEVIHSIEVVAVTANELLPFQYLDGWSLVPREKLNEIDFDIILVMNRTYYNDIFYNIVNLGIDKEKIVPCRVLDIPNFDFNKYVKLKKSNISIISNNCWGGIAYHTLGLECLSPFKNLALDCENYLKLLIKFEYYMQLVPEFVEYRVDPHSKEKYPVMRIDDVLIHFNHDKMPEEAVEKWERRKKKINYNNIYIMMYTENIKDVEEFLKIENYKNKICFIPSSMDSIFENDYLYKLEMVFSQKEFYETVNGNAGNGKFAFSYNLIDLLNMKINYRYS